MLHTIRAKSGVAVLGAAALVLAACGDADEPDALVTEDAEDADVEDADAEDAEDAEADDVEVTLAVGETQLGEHLVDGEGLTLYLFDVDEPGVSNCTDDCLDAWPPLTVDGEPTLGEGVDAELVDTIERDDDGSIQVTYDGLPLYYWAGDAAPGDVAGQGVEDVWWVVAPDGGAITDAVDDDEDEGGVY